MRADSIRTPSPIIYEPPDDNEPNHQNATPSQNSDNLLQIIGRQTRAASLGSCLGVSEQAIGALSVQQQGFNRIRRRSTRRHNAPYQKAVNFSEWANKR